jgi:hypothetical protein
MGFLTGRVSYLRCKPTGKTPNLFNQETLDRLAEYSIDKQSTSSDDVTAGWIAGEHILDTRFDLAKNIVNDALHFSFRIDSTRPPSDLKRAYFMQEVATLAAQNPSGFPSNKQRREAREIAEERLEEEAKDGRYTRRRAIPLLWDAQTKELLIGTTSMAIVDRLHRLFADTFDMGFDVAFSGRQAHDLAELRQLGRAVEDAQPTDFVPGHSAQSAVAWQPDENSRDFLGNEFLLWLWYVLDTEADHIRLSDNSDATIMITRSLTLECPRGESGRESISSAGPTQLPEARRAVENGKLPRKLGMILVRHDQQYELALQGETLAISGCKLPQIEDAEPRVKLEERITQIRHLVETMDLLYDAFLQRRIGGAWAKDILQMQKWLNADFRARATG